MWRDVGQVNEQRMGLMYVYFFGLDQSNMKRASGMKFPQCGKNVISHTQDKNADPFFLFIFSSLDFYMYAIRTCMIKYIQLYLFTT